MNLRKYLQRLKDTGELVTVTEPISKKYEIAAVMKKLEPQPVLFENVKESEFGVVGNLFCTKGQFADYFGWQVSEIIPKLKAAIDTPAPLSPPPINPAPCQEVVHLKPNLDEIPIPFHFPGDGGVFITSGVVITSHPVHGQNMDFHRCMQISPTEMAVRVVGGRHFHTYLEDLGQVDVAVCIGNTPNVLAAGAISVELGVDELTIANALQKLPVV